MRPLKVRDENLPPTALPGKTLQHSRHKSSPALSTFAHNGTLKNMAKRTAFADVSNTSYALQPITDGVALNKQPITAALQEKPQQDASKAAPLQRPAQRPISVSGLKGFFNHLTTSNAPNGAPKPPPHEVPVSIKPSLTKRATTVFREPDTTAPALADPPAISEPIKIQKPVARRNTASAAVAQPTIKEDIAAELLSSPARPTSSSSNAFHDAQSELNAALPPLHAPSNVVTALDPVLDVAIQPAGPLEAQLVHKGAQTKPIVNDQDLVSARPPSNRRSEASENWEYAYEDEDDAYTTMRSVKSRGDYTTSQSTVVLAPKMTTRNQQEIAAAKAAVDAANVNCEIEDDENWDTSMVAEYSEEIFEYMRTLEKKMLPNAYYMDNQTEVQWSMRSVLMDWLVQVHHRFNLLPETLYLTVNYIDRFLSCKVVSLGKLQLVGATAIFVAAKYEEINCPSVQEIVYMVDNGYSIDEILKAERFMLSMLQFELGWPGPMSFLRRISKADDYDLETRTLSKYLLEITIMDERFVGSPPSYTAAASHCLSRLLLKKGGWTQKHVYYSGYTYSQLVTCLNTLLSCCEDAQKHHGAVFDKYTDKRHKRVSIYVRDQMIMGFRLPRNARPSQIEGLDDWTRMEQPSMDSQTRA